MPIVAIAAAAIADISAAGAFSAAMAGTVTVTSALEMTAAVGATLGAIGMVTHDKTLSQVGMIMGGVGGLGSLAVNAGLFGADAGSTVLFGESAASTGATAGAQTASAVNAAAEAPQESVIKSLGETDNTIVPTQSNVALPGIDSAKQVSGAGTSIQGVAPKAGGLINGTAVSTPATSSSAPAATVAGAPAANQGFWGSLLKNPYAQYGMVQAAGAFLAGATDETKDLQNKILKQQLANAQAPIPVASRITAMPVTGQPTGIINAPAAGMVTGAPQ